MARKPNTPSLSASKVAAKAPSKVVVTKPQVKGDALITTAAAPATPPAPVAAAPAAPATVALRGGLAISTVKLTGKQYRVGAEHNQKWWALVAAGVQAGQGTAAVADLVKAGVPATFVGYVVRRGYAAAA
jgi:hypothetical protein